MVNIIKRAIVLIIALLFIPVNCAGAFGVVPLEGSVEIITLERTLGMTLEELFEIVGPPSAKEECLVPFIRNGRETEAEGRGFLWDYGYAGNPSEVNIFELRVCTIKGVVVSEQREWWYSEGDLIGMGQTDFADPRLVKELVEDLLEPFPEEHLKEYDHSIRRLEI